ncbi:YjjW family glycine radical enzyme activase [Tepidibacter thalassicus]|uniref:Glycine radical enzyme activase, YjjW family n=1 Tax=Tepidibacter thalassicus DSM 15285 TaxID=1123350 RepID=A0A1M5Q1D3_9FIRM|nr:YjjW family glycine radical enzyme activase [Tepidibacter thalassicus]SHH08087.1 glycine radical enzyme activase, YjjW family [Tepidibacter thalassicus DSM 15285]
MRGLVNKIIPFSSVDGPGNRTVIFMQGCNFNCLYCHNPETINVCNSCGICVSKCPYNALMLKFGNVIWDKNICKMCDLCLQICKNNSSPKATYMSVDEVLKEINKVKSFISGITVSGGECTLQSEFLVDLFKKVKSMGLTVFIDTNASIPLYEKKELVDLIDMAMVDIKAYDFKEHKMLTGKGNDVVIENVKYLAKINKLYEIRTVIVPGVLNNYYNVDMISKLLVSLNSNIRYKIIKYRPIGVRKDIIDSCVPSEDMMEELLNLAVKNGCENVILV